MSFGHLDVYPSLFLFIAYVTAIYINLLFILIHCYVSYNDYHVLVCIGIVYWLWPLLAQPSVLAPSSGSCASDPPVSCYDDCRHSGDFLWMNP